MDKKQNRVGILSFFIMSAIYSEENGVSTARNVKQYLDARLDEDLHMSSLLAMFKKMEKRGLIHEVDTKPFKNVGLTDLGEAEMLVMKDILTQFV